MQQQTNQAYQPVPQQDQSYPPTQAGYFGPPPGKDAATVTSQPALSPVQNSNHQQRHSVATPSLLSPNASEPGYGSIAGRESFNKINGPASPTITEVDGSGRPLPEADSIQRPTSTHQGMVSPMGSSAGSPPPPGGHFMQQHGNPDYGHQPGQPQVYNGYVAPHPGTQEVAHTQPHMGPYEMPNDRH